MRSLSIAATGMNAQQMNVDNIANNIANSTTTGFKKQRLEFVDLFYQVTDQPGTQSSANNTFIPSGLQIGTGVRPVASYRIHTQGSIEMTNSQFDIAINGAGFLQVQLPTGELAFTRAGSLQINGQGELVTPQGLLIQPSIIVPEDAIAVDINESGEFLVSLPGQVNQQNIGQIELADFVNKAGLEPIGDTLFVETLASGTPLLGQPGDQQFGRILQGMLERSNVDAVTELTNLISAQRAYEMNSNVISTSDEMLSTVSQLR